MAEVDISKLLIDRSADLKTALKKMSEGAEEVLFVIDRDAKISGVVTDGDIRRWILSTGELIGTVEDFYNSDPILSLIHI